MGANFREEKRTDTKFATAEAEYNLFEELCTLKRMHIKLCIMKCLKKYIDNTNQAIYFFACYHISSIQF